jgi:flagellar basal body-associated protein FliL
VPNWLIVILVLIAVVPGVVIVLAGVFAMFVMPADANARPTEETLPQAATEADASRE